MSLWQKISEHISSSSGVPFTQGERKSIGGGCINSAFAIEGSGRRYFVKLNDASRVGMFEAEAAGLQEILQTHTIRAPQPICVGAADGSAYLVLEYIDMRDGDHGQEALGKQLAALHQVTAPEFGWNRDNTIGSTPQINTRCGNWPDFWRDQRLGIQLKLAAENGYSGVLQRKGERLQSDIAEFFANYSPRPALLHGDLWSGNYGVAGDIPVIFDPAVYYGDREADLAMTELFGGFSARFYAAYRDALPLDAGYPVRKTLYNLYHILNHLNLFGDGYRAQAEQMMDKLQAELR